MRPEGLTCAKCGRTRRASSVARSSTCPSCAEVVALTLELEACEDRWAKQRVRLATLRSDGTLVRPNGWLIVPFALVSTTACVALVRHTVIAREADGLPFLLSLAATAVAVLSLVQLRRWLAYELGKRTFLHGRHLLAAAIAKLEADVAAERSGAPPSVGELRGARHASAERAAQ
jgi:hypothetical protein